MTGILLLVLNFLYYAVYIYEIVLIIRILLSWVNPDPTNRLVAFLYSITDPLLDLTRKYIPIRIGMLDLSPIFLIIILSLVQRGIQILAYLATRAAG